MSDGFFLRLQTAYELEQKQRMGDVLARIAPRAA
jgi:hypothetical protein